MGKALKFLQTILWKMEGIELSVPPNKRGYDLNETGYFKRHVCIFSTSIKIKECFVKYRLFLEEVEEK